MNIPKILREPGRVLIRTHRYLRHIEKGTRRILEKDVILSRKQAIQFNVLRAHGIRNPTGKALLVRKSG